MVYMTISLDNTVTISSLQDALRSLQEYAPSLSKTEFLYAKETILALHAIETHKAAIIAIPNENERNTFITTITGIIAEEGLFPGQSPEEIVSSIDTRIQAFIKTFFHQKECNLLNNFFKYSFVGPPCLNGRIITSEWYGFSQHGEKHPLFFYHHTDADADAVVIEELMYIVPSDDSSAPRLEQLQEYINTHSGAYPEAAKILVSNRVEAVYARACTFFVK